MLRVILGAILGFIVWTILLLGSDAVWVALSPDWYGKHQADFQAAINNKTPFLADTGVMIVAIFRSAIFSLITGFIAALISRESFKSPLLLGIFLVAFGAFIHSMMLDNVPIWYHILILIPIIPLTLLGGKLKGQKQIL
ncbi:MAG: hypothetical protein LUM44_21855 [Pyrinomonadaceae bacterium]|nr:hypothetical protein [Pyrinomonadaceae bacterium]